MNVVLPCKIVTWFGAGKEEKYWFLKTGIFAWIWGKRVFIPGLEGYILQ
jgi:hypothetical protein